MGGGFLLEVSFKNWHRSEWSNPRKEYSVSLAI